MEDINPVMVIDGRRTNFASAGLRLKLARPTWCERRFHRVMRVLYLRFRASEPLSLSAVATELGVSVTRIRQIQAHGLNALRNF